MIQLRGTGGLVIFLVVLAIFECFFGIVAYYVPTLLGATGIVWGIIALVIFIVLNIIFVDIN